jgi:hypothetical protein
VVGATGSASAAPELPDTPNLGELSALDRTSLGDKAVNKTTPAVDTTGETVARKASVDATRSAHRALGEHAQASGNLPVDSAHRDKSLLPRETPLKGTTPPLG